MPDKTLGDILWVTVSAAFVLIMQGGFLCLEAGLTRSKNSINVAIKNLTDFGISVCLYWAVGFAIMFGTQGNAFVGHSLFFVPIENDQMWRSAFFLYQVMFCGTAVTIVSGAAAERLRFRGYILIAALVSGVIYPLFGHWAWSGIHFGIPGWLASCGFVDFAGSSVVHSVGGWVALAVVMTIGPRTGRFPAGQKPTNIPHSNLPFAMLGAVLLWFGWIGFNGGSTFALSDQIPGIIARTMLAGGSGMLTALLIGWKMQRYPNPLLVINGSLAGLVAITACVHAINAQEAILIGSISGVILILVSELLEHFQIDDVVGAFPVHAACGIWGTMAVGLMGHPDLLDTGLNRSEQIMAQLLGVVVCAVTSFGITYLMLFIINRIYPLRVSAHDEYRGLNVSEHNATTEVYDFFETLKRQKESKDFSLRVPVEPFTLIGQIAKSYNAVMDSLQESIGTTEAIVNTAKDALVTFLKHERTITSVNPSAELIFGYRSHEIIGKPIDVLINPKEKDTFNNLLRSTETQADHATHELNGARADGSEFPMETSIIDSPQITSKKFFIANFRDITQRKKNEAQLLLQSAALKAATNPITITDNTGKILWVNPAFSQVTGYSFNEVIGKNPRILKSGKHTPQFYKELWDTIRSGKVWSNEMINRRKDGSLYYEHQTITPLINEQNEVTHFIAIKQDMTKHKEMAEERILLEAQIQQSKKLESVGTMANGIAHNFNNILGAIRGFIDMARMDTPPKSRVNKDLEKALHSIEEAKALANQILIFSRQQKREFSEINLSAVITDAMELFEASMHTPVTVIKKIPKKSIPIMGNAIEIKQVIINLCTNAYHATLDNEGLIELNLRTIRVDKSNIRRYADLLTGDFAHISVNDTGHGMSKEVMERIFEPFYTTKEIGKGTGLGLSVIHGIVKNHDGHIKVSSQPGKGTKFDIYIPLRHNARNEGKEHEKNTCG